MHHCIICEQLEQEGIFVTYLKYTEKQHVFICAKCLLIAKKLVRKSYEDKV